MLTAPLGRPDSLKGTDVFGPWTNHWSGAWSNGTMQYHLWDHARPWHDQWIQPVTQSETHFSDKGRLGAMIRNREVDLAIDVYSHEDGITGWVSKRQHGPVEIPCIGYLLEETTLLWICQPQEPHERFAPTTEWFVFLERCDAASNARRYRIYGHPVRIDGTVTWNAEERGAHRGRYCAERPA